MVFRAAIYLSLFENGFISINQIFSFITKQYPDITKEQVKDILEVSYQLGGVVKSNFSGEIRYSYLGFLDSNSKYCFANGVFLYTKGADINKWQPAINYLNNQF